MVKKPWPRKQDIWTLPFISFWPHLSPLISLDFSLLVWKTHCSLWSLSFYAALTFSTLIGESRSSIFHKEGIYLLYQIKHLLLLLQVRDYYSPYFIYNTSIRIAFRKNALCQVRADWLFSSTLFINGSLLSLFSITKISQYFDNTLGTFSSSSFSLLTACFGPSLSSSNSLLK